MKKPSSVFYRFFFAVALFMVSGCSGFTGIRQPLYDGQPVEPNEEAIEAYRESGEIIGAEKDYYIRYSFSEDIYQDSLDYTTSEPLLLTGREYTIGEDIPAGRVSLLGNESVFTSENYDAHVGNFVIYDEVGEVYFENLFHSLYGQLVAQVDFIPGHTIEIIGSDVEITAFYSPEFPENPYVLMDPPKVLENLGQTDVQQPLVTMEEENLTILSAGIYEVGVHLEPGVYEMTDVYAPHNTEMYLFQEGMEPRVFELILEEQGFVESEEDAVEIDGEEEDNLQIELQAGDKIYPNLVTALIFEKIEAN